MDLKGKRVMVVGLGASGVAAARLLAAAGSSLVLTDARADVSLEKLPHGELHLGGEDPRWLADVELVVVSPGVAPASALVRAASAARIPIISELELGSRFVRAPMIAITGTNGKSTVTVLIGEILKAAGMETFVGGNLGTPLSDAAGHHYDAVVIEVSSYQLERIETFKPKITLHLNLAEDHLDRYESFDQYAAAKARLFENQDRDDWAILNRDDPSVWSLAGKVRARVFAFGLARPKTSDAIWFTAGAILFEYGSRRGKISLDSFRLPGRHNVANAMAAAAAALTMAIEPQVIERTLANFPGLAHRIEFVREKDGVTYIDDSKGTNVGAVVEALAAVRGPAILIAGGVDKGGDYAPLCALLREKARLVVLIGAAREKMSRALEGAAEIEMAPALADAVKIAQARARSGDTVLLSPACSSFDQFSNYAERGRIFQELVRAL
jgi:UDP-N-acetylmuramoylalanine--D-glutamate ligase